MGKRAQVIAIDLGASGGKCFSGLFDDNGFSLREIHRFSHEPTTLFVADRGGRVEERTYWNDLLIHANVVEGLRAYRKDVASSTDGVGIDTWGSDGVFVTADGVLLGPMYSYRDHRLDGMVDQVKAKIDARRIYQITGIHFQPFNISNQLLWFAQNRGDLLKKGVRFLPASTLFSFYLAGTTAVDSTWASVTQLMDCRKRKWSREVLRALGIPSWVMPEIVPPATVVGQLRPELAQSVGLNSAPLIAVASHDTASAYTAAPVGNPATALIISSGTWSLIGKILRKPNTGDEALEANLSNEGAIGGVRFLKNCMGTWLVQELRRAWRGQDGREIPWDEMNRLTESGQPFAAFLDPDDRSFYNPANMETAIQEFCKRTGQTAPRERGTLLRCVYESLALKYRMVAEQIATASGKPNRVVHIVGGGSRNEFLNQLAANACRLPVVAGPEEATAAGNAMAQGLALGAVGRLADIKELIRSAFPIREYKPKDPQTWEQAYQRYRQVVR